MKQTFYDRHRAAILSGAYPEGMINGFRKAYHAVGRERKGYTTGARSAAVSYGELRILLDLIADNKPRVTDPQCAKGKAYLEKHRRKLGTREQAVLDALEYFQLIGFRDEGNNGLPFLIPVYRAVATNSRSFDYCCVAWQSGGSGPEVCN